MKLPKDGIIKNGIVYKKDALGEWWLCEKCTNSAGSKIEAIYHKVGQPCSK